MDKYYRFSYNGIGIYEALKKELWNMCDNPVEEWNELKSSEFFNWLKVPHVYPINGCSYFTVEGYNLFMERSYPIFIKYMDKDKIIMEEFIFDEEKLKIVYQDKHQIVIN